MVKNPRNLKRKGNLQDPIDAAFIIFTLVFTLFLMFNVNTNISSGFKNSTVTNITQLTENFDTYNTRYANGWDFGIFFLALLFPVFSYIAARKIPVETKTIIILFFMVAFFLIAGIVVANMHGQMLENVKYATFVDGTIFIKFLMPKMLYYVMSYLLIVIIGLFTKPEGDL